ncbi:30S ribosome-binding factor RbfA [bacterium]|nr:30S ribosome-binding factor RbfA [bacterium]
MVMQAAKPPSQRQLRVGEVVRQAVYEMLVRGDIISASIDMASVTVSQVSISPDLKNATVFLAPLAGRDSQQVLNEIRAQGDHIRRVIGKKVYLRFVPRLHFKIDDSFDKASRVHEILLSERVQRDIQLQGHHAADEDE